MEYLFIQYPKCSTCKKAKKWLEDNNISFEDRHDDFVLVGFKEKEWKERLL